jgi:large subunit ribosomal protein L25
MDEEIHTTVPIKFIGEAPAVKALGGVLVKAITEIKITALPANIPAEIAVDLSVLENLNQSLYVKDLPISDKYKFEVDASNVVVTVAEQREEEVTPVAAPSVDEVVVETEEKKAARDAAKAPTAETTATPKK